MSDATRIPVGGDQPYDVVVGHDLLGELPVVLGGGVSRVAVIYPGALDDIGKRVLAGLQAAGIVAQPLVVPNAEDAKTAEVAASCWAALGRSGFTRSDAIVGVGGGATTDLAGFVAATWMRGIRVVHLPTSLLGMVDAAVGGKTGINTEEGKNLVGAFHPPAGVLCDLELLGTLPREDYVAGLAEVVKCGFIADSVILDRLEADFDDSTDPAGPLSRELVERSIRVKAEVVAGDLRESGRREILNYGHTLGHAVERREHYRWRHGHAISVGMIFAAELARATGALDKVTADRHRRILTRLGLPVSYPRPAWPDLLDMMRVDKKARGNLLRFVILEGLAKPRILANPEAALLAAAWDEVCREGL